MEDQIGKGHFHADDDLIGAGHLLLAYLRAINERHSHHLYQYSGTCHEPYHVLLQDKV